MRNQKRLFRDPRFLIACMALMAGCSEKVGQNEEGSLSTFDVNLYALNNLVCDPMGERPPSEGLLFGLKADLYYLKEGQSRFYTAGEYIANGQKSPQHLFFTQLFVPTRLFNTGFPLETGGFVKNDKGEKLEEFFALRFASVLKLRPEQQTGDYEVALLSDDGSVLRIRNDQGVYENLVVNDGDHPTKFGCSPKILTMNRDSEHVMQLDYYQGPRYHISLIPMWRRIDGARMSEPLCGHSGNHLYFNPDTGSTPQQAYNDLLTRGWEPIKAGNYQLPLSAQYNPCTTVPGPKIMNLEVVNDPDSGLLVTWETDVLATAQVLYTKSDTGEEVLTKSDNVLRRSHFATLPLPAPGSSYSIRAIAVGANMGRTVSAPVIFEY